MHILLHCSLLHVPSGTYSRALGEDLHSLTSQYSMAGSGTLPALQITSATSVWWTLCCWTRIPSTLASRC